MEWLETNGDKSKVYVLPDGFLYMWMLIEREVSTGGGYTNLTKTFEESRLNSYGALVATAGVVITLNEEITEGNTEIITEYAWANTGHAFVPADYENRISDLEEEVLQLKNAVGTQGGSTSEAVTINRKTRMIYCTRIGAGEDREIEY